MRSRILANLGFILQISGLLTILPIAIGFYLNETDQLVSLFLTCVGFLAAGFLMNALSERKELDFKSSSALFLAAFIILPLLGAIPYFYNDPFNSPNYLERFTNGYFESVSAFTTTGFSFIQNSDTLARSMLFYRSLTELMGGVGVVFLLLVFFQNRRSLNHLGNTMGLEDICHDLKRTFLYVLAIYSAYILIFTVAFYMLGFQDVIRTGSFMIDTITGGFQPSVSQFQRYLALAPKILLTILMFLGSVNFAFNYRLFTRKIKQAFSRETVFYILIIVFSTFLVFSLSGIPIVDSLFHVVSMSSSTGFDYINIAGQNNTVLAIFIVLMMIGGCAFSMAGGIRVSRLIASFRSIKETIRKVLARERGEQLDPKTETNNVDLMSAPAAILLLIFTLVIFAIIFTTMGVSFTDALFEVGSALTTNGISMGATTATMPIGYKWLMIVAMTIGRVEIMSVLIAILPSRTKK